MSRKNPLPLTQPEPGDPNYQKSCYQPGSLHTTDLPMQPSLAEQMHGAEKDPVQVPPFDHKACILCDHVIVQQVLGNKCGKSGSLCCNMKECPIEARKKRDAVPVPIVKEEIPCCENCDNFQERDNVQMGEWITVHTCMGEIIPESQSMCTRLRGCLSHPGARAYLNKNVIAELERLKTITVPTKQILTFDEVIALLRGDGE